MKMEAAYEYLDNLVCDFDNRMDQWFHSVSRCGWAHPLAFGVRRDFPDSAFRSGEQNRRVSFSAIAVCGLWR
jgi:hypothetical protein